MSQLVFKKVAVDNTVFGYFTPSELLHANEDRIGEIKFAIQSLFRQAVVFWQKEYPEMSEDDAKDFANKFVNDILSTIPY